MKKTLSVTLLLLFFVAAVAVAAEREPAQSNKSTYTLDEEKINSYQLDELVKQTEPATSSTIAKQITEDKPSEAKPKVITEITASGKIEKLVDVDGRVIAEKVIENDKIVKKVLNYYYPDGILMRQIVAHAGTDSFYAEEYYNNGKIAIQATYINEGNKIGKEKRYDSKGTLRQEIPWVLPKTEENKPTAEQTTIRQGEIITYYPNGRVAARFPVGIEGKSIFYSQLGMPIKTIESTPILSFAKEKTTEDCKDITLQLDLDELIELYEDEGDISYDKCGLPYHENFLYEILDTQGNSTTMLSYDEQGMLRRITPYIKGKRNGAMQKFDAAGNLTAEINYTDGLKEGYATGYFPNNNPAFLKKYVKGKVEGTMNCYFPDGKIAAQVNYKNGLKEGKAVINSPIQKTLEFSQDKLLNEYQKRSKRKTASALSNLTSIAAQCLNVEKKLADIAEDISLKEKEVNQAFTINLPEECADMGSFKVKQGQYYCYNADNKRLASYPINYIRGGYVSEKIYTPEDKIIYEIPYEDKLRQGWSRQYDTDQSVITEIYYDKGKEAGTSHSYYANGRIENVRKISEDEKNKIMARYNELGDLEFSLSYKNANKDEAYLLSENKRKNITVKYYEDKPDIITEINAADESNFIEYNFALGEYVIYENNQPVKGGKICPIITQEFPLSLEDNISAINEKPQEEIIIKEDTGEETTKDTNNIKEEKLQTEENHVEENTTVPEITKEEAAANIAAINAAQEAAEIEIPPVIIAEMAPIVEDIEDISAEVKEPTVALANVVMKTAEEEKQAELAAKNIGPIAKPDIENLTETVQKERLIEGLGYTYNGDESKTERLYYPNGNIRKTIKTKGSRTEEIKEYSKTGLLLTDYMYNPENIEIEKYFGSGEVRRKITKSYDDNAVMAFISREDYFDTGKPRYTFKRKDGSILFSEESYYPDGALKSLTEQILPLSFKSKEYDSLANLLKETEQEGVNELVKEYDENHILRKLTMNGKEIPAKLAENSAELFKDNARMYNAKGKLTASLNSAKDYNEILSYYSNGKPKVEVKLYQSGEISVKKYNEDGVMAKFAHLAPDGKLYIEKPEIRVIPNYRERHWVDYNNPNWVENVEKYTIKAIARLTLGTVSKILETLAIEEPEIIGAMKTKF